MLRAIASCARRMNLATVQQLVHAHVRALYRAGVRLADRAHGLAMIGYVGDRRLACCCSSGCRPASCRPRIRACAAPIHPAGRRDPGPHRSRRGQDDRALFPEEGQGGHTAASMTISRLPFRRATARMPARGFLALKPWDERKGAEHRRQAIAAGRRAISRHGCAMSILRAQSAAGARVRQVDRLHARAAQYRRHQPRNFKPRAPAARACRADPRWHRCASTTCPTRRRSMSTSIPDKVGRARHQPDRRQQHALDRMGRQLHQRLRRSRAREARLCAGRCAVSRGPRISGMVRPQFGGTMAPYSAFCARSNWTKAPNVALTASTATLGRIAGQARAGRQLGRRDGPHGRELAAEAAGRVGRLGGPLLSGATVRWAGARALCLSLVVVFLCLAALYESWSMPIAVMLVVPLGVIGARSGVMLRGLDQRRLFPGRPAHDDGAVGQECDPDRRIRRAGGEEGMNPLRCGARGGAHPSAPDHDDQPRVHVRRVPARHRDRCGRAEPDRDRHGGDRRHAHRDGARDLLRAAVLRAGRRLFRKNGTRSPGR
jgi:hypothetical protein